MGASILRCCSQKPSTSAQGLKPGSTQLRIRSGRRGLLFATLCRHNPYKVNEVPAQFFLHAFTFLYHFPFALVDIVNELSVVFAHYRRWFPPIVRGQLIGITAVAFAT